MDKHKKLYHNRIAKLIEVTDTESLVNKRIEKYYDDIFIDEIQDFAGHDFNFLHSLAQAKVNTLFVGDFYQHTFDTSRDGNLNKGLHENFEKYVGAFKGMGLQVDRETLGKSYRCSPTVCAFINENLGIKMESHRDDKTSIELFDQEEEIKRIFYCDKTVKLFYKEHYKYGCYSRNWGDSKGEDKYSDVCVVLNKTSFEKFRKSKLHELKPQTRNKLYVACTRARNNIHFVQETQIKNSFY